MVRGPTAAVGPGFRHPSQVSRIAQMPKWQRVITLADGASAVCQLKLRGKRLKKAKKVRALPDPQVALSDFGTAIRRGLFHVPTA